jgi:Tfp pilus assembly protein PilF
MKNASVLADFNRALTLQPQHAYLLYNRGCLFAQQQDYTDAIADFTRALANEPHLAEAYFNRGLCALKLGQQDAGIQDLSKAGEMGLYTAYSIIKKYRK